MYIDLEIISLYSLEFTKNSNFSLKYLLPRECTRLQLHYSEAQNAYVATDQGFVKPQLRQKDFSLKNMPEGIFDHVFDQHFVLPTPPISCHTSFVLKVFRIAGLNERHESINQNSVSP